jgi:hypothetical protein
MNPLTKRWKVVGATAAVAALGIVGTGLPGTGSDLALPDAINLRDRVPVTEAAQEQAAPDFEIVPLRLAGDSFDSPFDSVPAAVPSGPDFGSADSPDGAPSASFDSPDDASGGGTSAPATSNESSFDSPDDASAGGTSAPATSSESSFDGLDSVSVDSPDAVPQSEPAAEPSFQDDSASLDSPDSFDSDNSTS